MDELWDKWKKFINSMNQHGIPLPLLRDSKSQMGSATYTMFWISFNLCVIGVIGKWAKVLDVDTNNAFYLLGITGGYYLSRKVIKDKNSVTIEPPKSDSDTNKDQ